MVGRTAVYICFFFFFVFTCIVRINNINNATKKQQNLPKKRNKKIMKENVKIIYL
jgi:hypothetical protein